MPGDFEAFDKMFGGASAPTPPIQPPTSAAAEPTPAPAPTAKADSFSKFDTLFKDSPSSGRMPTSHTSDFNTPGSRPDLPLPSSPLNIIQRAALGAVDSPDKQAQYLAEHFGKENVKFIPASEDKAGWVVKGDDGKWSQVDPTGMSDWHMSDIVPNEKWSRVGKDLIGSTAQFMGQHALELAGAGQAVAAGAPAIAGATAVAGPIGGIAATLGLAGAGAMGGRATDMGFRAAINQASPDSLMAQALPTSGEATSQLAASFIFGASQEMLGKVGAGVLGAAGNQLAKGIRLMGDTPDGRQAAGKLVSMVGNIPEQLGRVWADNPTIVGKDLDVALADQTNRTSILQNRQRGMVQQFEEQAKNGLRRVGSDFDQLVKDAGTKGASFDPTSATGDAIGKLQQAGYIDAKGKIVETAGQTLGHDLSEGDTQAIKSLLNQHEVLANKQAAGRNIPYEDARLLDKNLNKYLTYGDKTVNDGQLKTILTQAHTDLKNVITQGLDKADPQLAIKYGELTSKYSDVADLVSQLSTKSKDAKADTFIKQIIRDDGSYNSALPQQAAELLGIDNPTERILQMEAARRSTGAFSVNTKFPFVHGAQPAGRAAEAMGKANGAITQATNAIPYIQKASDTFRTLSNSAKATVAKSPQAINQVIGAVIGGVQSEQQMVPQLLKQYGVVGGGQQGAQGGGQPGGQQ